MVIIKEKIDIFNSPTSVRKVVQPLFKRINNILCLITTRILLLAEILVAIWHALKPLKPR